MNFASDNTAGIAPEILQAFVAGNDGFAMGYGNDDATRAVERRIGEIFEHDVAMFLVPTGTAANALALAHVSAAVGRGVLPCRGAHHHRRMRRAGILRRRAQACRHAGRRLQGGAGDTEKRARSYEGRAAPGHAGGALVAQASEAGTIYRPGEIAALAEVARAHGMKVHMDGARFANALVRMNASPAEVTWKSGVDVLSFGATKGGAMAAEAVVFFDRELAASMAERRKRAGHLMSKHRFLARSSRRFWPTTAGCGSPAMPTPWPTVWRRAYRGRPPPVWPVEANLVFIALPKAEEARLRAAGARFTCGTATSLPAGLGRTIA